MVPPSTRSPFSLCSDDVRPLFSRFKCHRLFWRPRGDVSPAFSAARFLFPGAQACRRAAHCVWRHVLLFPQRLSLSQADWLALLLGFLAWVFGGVRGAGFPLLGALPHFRVPCGGCVHGGHLPSRPRSRGGRGSAPLEAGTLSPPGSPLRLPALCFQPFGRLSVHVTASPLGSVCTICCHSPSCRTQVQIH